MRANVIDCSDHNAEYGILTVKDKSLEEVQAKINEIKKELHDNGIHDWCIDDVLKKFPEDWEYSWEETTDDEIEI